MIFVLFSLHLLTLALLVTLFPFIVYMKKRTDVTPSDKSRAMTKYGNVTYADSVNKKYPLDTPEHVRAAASYWGMPKNKAKYTPEEKKIISRRINSAKRKFGIE